jgi:hypothetical protein
MLYVVVDVRLNVGTRTSLILDRLCKGCCNGHSGNLALALLDQFAFGGP